MPRPLRVFLCHASQDKPAVLELYNALKAESWIDPWLDEEKISFGQHWTTVIEKAIDESDVVLIFLSRNSVHKKGFIQRELNYAWDISLEKPHDVIFLIPLRLDSCEIPRFLNSRQWGNYFGDKKKSNYQILLRSLQLRYEQIMSLEEMEQDARVIIALEETKREAAERVAREKIRREHLQWEIADKAVRDKAQLDTKQKDKQNSSVKKSLPIAFGSLGFLILIGAFLIAGFLMVKRLYPSFFPPALTEAPLATKAPAPAEATAHAGALFNSTSLPTQMPIMSMTPTSPPTQMPILLPTPTPFLLSPTLIPYWLYEIYQEKRGNSLFWVLTSIFSILFVYFVGVGALIISAWKKGSALFSRSWLTKLASKPLLISPGIGKWALFLGYRKRLQNQSDVLRASTKFFGVPGIEPDGKNILPDSTGIALIQSIAKSLDFQQPALIEAKGGGGKTTLLARWSYLALNNGLPAQFKGYKPIFITPAYYADNLIDSIASVLRERDGVAIDKDMVQAQLETGKYLVLFDGVSEIIGDQNKGLQEILRATRNADYRNCRFIITTRPGLTIPSEIKVFRLQPLSAEIVLQFLPLYQLDREQEFQVKKQLSLFGKKPIEPLLFNMIIEQGRNDILSPTRSQLYERFFRRQLRVTTDTMWEGWRTILGEFARWFVLETGRRGVGKIHETLVDQISMKPGDQNTSSLLERGKKYYQLPVENELYLLEKLQASAVFQRGKRWQFAHDTYEEYFVACYISSYLTIHEKLPNLDLWTINDDQILSFVGVIEFLKEMADDELMKILLNAGLPVLWLETLMTQAKDNG
jgi:hypothetical protein